LIFTENLKGSELTSPFSYAPLPLGDVSRGRGRCDQPGSNFPLRYSDVLENVRLTKRISLAKVSEYPNMISGLFALVPAVYLAYFNQEEIENCW
jgi:hypothetical protein